MLAVNYSTIRENLKSYCDKVTEDNEAVIVTRKDEKNVVLISLEEYNLLQKAYSGLEKLLAVREGLAAAENDRAAGISGCTVSELDSYLSGIIAEV